MSSAASAAPYCAAELLETLPAMFMDARARKKSLSQLDDECIHKLMDCHTIRMMRVMGQESDVRCCMSCMRSDMALAAASYVCGMQQGYIHVPYKCAICKYTDASKWASST
jgi:hypothetical protein